MESGLEKKKDWQVTFLATRERGISPRSQKGGGKENVRRKGESNGPALTSPNPPNKEKRKREKREEKEKEYKSRKGGKKRRKKERTFNLSLSRLCMGGKGSPPFPLH